MKLQNIKKIIGSKWVFKRKINKQGIVERFKARLCAKGFSQIEGLDYNETYAPVMRYKSLRIILALAAIKDMEIKQMDVETAFLNADISEEVYMEIPEGVSVQSEKLNLNKRFALKLNKALYGTKQASHNWNVDLNQFILSLHFTRCISDPCVYFKITKTGKIIILSTFVDDIIIAYSKIDETEWLENKIQLERKYKMKDLGEANWILGMRITRDRKLKSLRIDHSVYIKKVLDVYNMTNCNKSDTPESSIKLLARDCPTTAKEKQDMKQIPYRGIVGAVIYTAASVRPDISHAANMVSRFQENPGKIHWQAAKRILRYLKGKSNLALVYKQDENSNYNSHIKINAYTDADWGGDEDGRRSTTGSIIQINNCVINWISKKQDIVAQSTTEAEYIAIAETVKEVKWLIEFLQELKFYDKKKETATIYTDNQAAMKIAQSENNHNHQRTKHIDIRYHFIKDEINNKTINVEWVSTVDQLADINTKALGSTAFKNLRDKFMSE